MLPPQALAILDPSLRGPGPNASRFRRACHRIVYSNSFEEFSVLIIVANTVLMACQYFGMNDTVQNGFDQANYAFTCYFTVEMIMKNIAVRPRRYFSQGLNVFDFLVVVVSLAEMFVGLINPDSATATSKLSFLRSFRLMRIFKLVRSWEDLNTMIDSMANAIGSLSWLCLFIFLYMFTFAILGQQLFSFKLSFCDVTGVPGAEPLCPPGESCGDYRNCFVPCDASQNGTWITYANPIFGGVPDAATITGFPAFDGSRYALGGLCRAYRAAPADPPSFLVDLGQSYRPLGNFDNVFVSLVSIFRILTFDNWVNVRPSS